MRLQENYPLKKKEVLQLMFDRENEIKSYIKENKINLRAASDVEKTIKYYNSL